jgi:SOS-response transcriptional repressor LexA
LSGRGILGGDYVLVSPSARAKDGDVVAARVGNRTSVRTLTHRGATIVLEASNAAQPPIDVGPRDDFAILGVVCAVFRPFFEQEPPPPADEEPEL